MRRTTLTWLLHRRLWIGLASSRPGSSTSAAVSEPTKVSAVRRWRADASAAAAALSRVGEPSIAAAEVRAFLSSSRSVDAEARSPDMMDLTADPTVPRYAKVPSEHWSSNVRIYNERFLELPASTTVSPVSSADDLRDSLPGALKEQFEKLRLSVNLEHLTPLQQYALPIVRQGQSACLIAPTGTGKTLTFLLPTLARALSEAEETKEAIGGANKSDDAHALEEVAAGHDIGAANVCRYCGLNVGEVRVCPETGAEHEQPSSSITGEDGDDDANADGDDAQQQPRVPRGLRHTSTVCMPIIIITAPSSMLVMQTHAVARRLHSNLKVREYFTAKAEQSEINRMSSKLNDADVLIIPLRNLHSLVQQKRVRFNRLQSIIFDEVESCFHVDSLECLERVLEEALRTRRNQRKAYNTHKMRAAHGAPLPSSITPAAAHNVQVLFVGAVLPRPVKLSVQKIFSALPGQSKFIIANVGNGSNDSVVTPVKHSVYLVPELDKASKLRELYDTGVILPTQRTLVFVNSRASVHWLAGELATLLEGHDINITKAVGAANVPITTTANAVQWFEVGRSTLLIATDILASGIDFKNVHNVVVFEMPRTFEEWVHRVGRCGRGGQVGHAITFFMPEDAKMAKPLVKALRERSQRVPPRLSYYAANSASDVVLASLHKHKLKAGDPERHTPATGSVVQKYASPYTVQLSRRRTPVS